MKRCHRRRGAGFTLVEIMIVVTIIGMLAALAVPGLARPRMRAQGERIMNDARIMDAAVDEWALETCARLGATVNTTLAAEYLKTAWPTNDVLGYQYVFTVVGSTQVQINAATKTALSGIGINWGNY